MAADIKTVKEKHQAALLALPGVVSVGIGLSEGEQVIIIGVDGKHPETIPKLPTNLEGYPVQTQTSGTIKAQ